ncbi:hypothetical protein [Massilia glaciei]|uniref:Uncharacterized protein n=1 Tax=Massilia glaciei TaxID=1524097 RepID=A0A2U2HP96_9BURK|nr:hypothetical protein [Massilia glaciei]PWF49331.1 hypothetical protein C7C56_006800 [Massilia glaciei]
MAEPVDIQYKQESITPFWQKLSFFFLFPFRQGPLVFLVGITIASALAGLALGGFGTVFKGTLIYLGLRYAFNVLELFSQGRFEGHSMEHSLWGGSERRPAKLGLVVALFLTLCVVLGNSVLDARIAKNVAVQEKLISQYKIDHAAEVARREANSAAFNKRIGLDSDDDAPVADGEAAPDSGDESPSGGFEAEPAESSEYVESGPSRAEIFAMYRPTPSDPLWYTLQPFWFWLVVVALSLMLPSAFIEFALEDKFFRALNPLHVFSFISSMGSAYFAMWSLVLLIGGARQLAMSAGAGMPAALRFPLEMAIAAYLGLVLFAMIGYALYQYHQELSLDVAVDFDGHRQAGGAEAIAQAGSVRAALRAREPTDPLERKLQPLLEEGKVNEAIAEVKDAMRYDRFDAKLNTRLHGLYALLGDSAKTLEHGQQWLTALGKADDGQGALAAVMAMYARDPEFMVENGDVILPAARAAILKRESAVAVKLVRSFDKRFPNHKDTAAVYFVAAKLASEHFRQHATAVKILRMLVAKFPADPVSVEAGTYLAVLEASIAQMSAA